MCAKPSGVGVTRQKETIDKRELSLVNTSSTPTRIRASVHQYILLSWCGRGLIAVHVTEGGEYVTAGRKRIRSKRVEAWGVRCCRGKSPNGKSCTSERNSCKTIKAAVLSYIGAVSWVSQSTVDAQGHFEYCLTISTYTIIVEVSNIIHATPNASQGYDKRF